MIQKRLSNYWMVLSFQSGIINSAGFVLFSIYLTHMTGLFSKIGLEAEQLNILALLWWICLPIFFLIGSLLSTVWIEGQAYRNKNPRYEWVFVLLAICMLVVGTTSLLSVVGLGVIGMIAFCAGAQNAIFNERTGAIMRSTHLTGTTTDLGISLARLWFKTLGHDPSRLAFEQRLVVLRSSSIGFFVLGSILGSLLAFRLNGGVFYIPAVIYLAMAFDATKVLKVLHANR